jgi:antitoxin MazE
MTIMMKSKVIKIGNSRGIRIPRTILEQVGLVDDVELIVEGKQLIIQPHEDVRGGWEDRFQAMNQNGEDKLMDGLISTEWDENEWTW